MRCIPPIVFALAVCLGSASTPIWADQPVYTGSSATNTQTLDCDTKAKNFDPFELGWLIHDFELDGGETSIRCVTAITNEKGKGRKGVKVTLDAEILDLSGQPLDDFGSRTRRTNAAGQASFDFGDLPIFTGPALASVTGRYSGSKKGTAASTTCTARERVLCEPDNETLCLLNDDRFRVDIDWRSFSGSGEGRVISSSFDEGTFFFGPGNGDLIVQLLNGCKNNNHFWVFANALTSVEYDLTVTDTETGAIKSYTNPLGQQAQAITDTAAFATCP